MVKVSSAAQICEHAANAAAAISMSLGRVMGGG
jgi:hypothetical protein